MHENRCFSIPSCLNVGLRFPYSLCAIRACLKQRHEVNKSNKYQIYQIYNEEPQILQEVEEI
ncbi:MAG TPA: hypothetical protein HA341_02870 [Halobacteria archaeon]|nr:hypothetical protein [Halobacteria archaeon]